jgi:hypothetical protein
VFDYAAYIVTLGFRVLARCHRGSLGFLDTVLEASCSTRDLGSLPDSPPAAPVTVASRVPETQERRYEPEKPDPPQLRAWARAGCPLQLRLRFYRDSTSGSGRGPGPGPGRSRCKLASARRLIQVQRPQRSCTGRCQIDPIWTMRVLGQLCRFVPAEDILVGFRFNLNVKFWPELLWFIETMPVSLGTAHFSCSGPRSGRCRGSMRRATARPLPT